MKAHIINYQVGVGADDRARSNTYKIKSVEEYA